MIITQISQMYPSRNLQILLCERGKKKKKKISKNWIKLSKTCNVIFLSSNREAINIKKKNNDPWKKSRITSNNANAEEIFKGGRIHSNGRKCRLLRAVFWYSSYIRYRCYIIVYVYESWCRWIRIHLLPSPPGSAKRSASAKIRTTQRHQPLLSCEIT